MGVIDIKMPRMGESVMEGTVLKWLISIGDEIEADGSLLEVGTDKVDSEIPSPHTGKLIEIIHQDGDIVPVGTPIGRMEVEGVEREVINETVAAKPSDAPAVVEQVVTKRAESIPSPTPAEIVTPVTQAVNGANGTNNGFFSPLVLNIAKGENVGLDDLSRIPGSGKDQRLTKQDLLGFIKAQSSAKHPVQQQKVVNTHVVTQGQVATPKPIADSYSGESEIIEMDRMRQIIAGRMVQSKQISPHVTSFVEADVTNIVYWRNRWKHKFKDREGLALTFTPIFAEAVIMALKDYPMMNASVDGTNIVVKKDINLGIAVALPSGNLVVPVIHNASQYNIVGLTQKVNELARKARANKLTADDLQGGTYTISNMGSFGNVMGTPILVQPQVGILALGAVVKKPAVVETPEGDHIAIRHQMFLSHSYDHRVVDGSLGGMFVRRVADYLERFDLERED